MVAERIFALFRREVGGLHQAAYILAAFALFSAILALARDRILAHIFGAGAELDAYYAAFKVPDLIFVGVASLFSVYALIPVLNSFGQETERARQFLGSIIAIFSLCAVLIAIAAFFAMPWLAQTLFPTIVSGAHGETFVLLSRLLLVQPLLLGLSGIMASITQTYGRFALYAIGPVLYNVGIIAGAIFLYPEFGLIGLGFGVLIGAALHLGVQLPFVFSKRFFAFSTLAPSLTNFWQVAKYSIPRTAALSSHHLLLFVFVALAALMAEGSVAVFTFAFNLQAVPLAIVGASYSVAAFPTLARLYAKGDIAAFAANLSLSIRHIIFWSLPLIALGIVLRAHIVRIILGSGAFDWADTRLTAAALALFLLSLATQGLVLLFARGYYAIGRSALPLIASGVGIIAAAVATGIGLLIINSHPELASGIERFLRAEELSATVLVLPAAYSIGSAVQALILWLASRELLSGTERAIGRTALAVGAASLIAALAAYGVLQVASLALTLDTFWGVFSQGFLAGIIGLGVYVAVLWYSGNREIRAVARTLSHRFGKVRTVAVEDIEL